MAQMLGSTVGDPTVGPGAQEPAFGGHYQPWRIRIERLRDQSFTDPGAVRVGGVDKSDAFLDRPPPQRYCLRLIPRRAPDPRAGNAHCAKTNLSDWQLGQACLGWHIRLPLSGLALCAQSPLQVVWQEVRLYPTGSAKSATARSVTVSESSHLQRKRLEMNVGKWEVWQAPELLD